MGLTAIGAACAVLAVAGCGRFDFEAHGDGQTTPGDGVDARIDGPPATGPLGPRYMEILDYNSATALVGGSNGVVAVTEPFQGATTIAGKPIAGEAMYESWAMVWFDPTGAPGTTTALDSTSSCDVRQLASANGAVISVGYAQATTGNPAYGACAIATGHQEGVAIRIDDTGAQQLDAHVVSGSFNTQTWYAAAFADGTLGVSGVYGGGAMIGSTALPVTASDENPFYARVDPATGLTSWTTALVSGDDIEAGPLDTDGDDACLLGSFEDTVTVLGTQMTSLGNVDGWIARVDGNGAPRWVRQIGSTGDEAVNTIFIAATADGGCTTALAVGGDLTLDAMSLPVSAGPSVLLHFDATGALAAGVRTPATVEIARVGTAVYGAVGCTQPCTIGGATYTPSGNDIAIFSISDQVTGAVIGALAGGAASIEQFSAVPPDALALTFVAQSQTSFGALSITPIASARALAVMGLAQ